METSILKKAVKFLKGRKKYAVALMGVLAITAVGYGMARPALTLEREVYCGLEEHTHTAECYAGYQDGEQETPGSAVSGETDSPAVEKQLNCTVTGPVAHTHGENCYGQDGSLICPLEEREAHTHRLDCYEKEGKLICGKEEAEGHTHDDSCYTVTKKLICGKEEAEAHTHDSSCYGSTLELTCGETEEEGHSHGDDCLDADGNIVCGKEETAGHTHGDSCYTEVSTGELVCGKEETEGHTHTGDCYEEVEELTCGKEEAEGHTHTEECYGGESKLICGKEELEEHVHGEGCFIDVPGTGTGNGSQGTEDAGDIGENSTGNAAGTPGEEMAGELICGKVEHVHTEECYDPKIMLLSEDDIDGDTWWKLNKDGVLTIQGTDTVNAIPDSASAAKTPWYKYRNQITSVNIEGMESIGKNAFNSCTSITDVKIGSGVTSIGESAFAACIELCNVEIPDGLVSIGRSAFNGCKALKDIKLPASLMTLGNSAFYSCSALTNVALPDGLETIGTDTFRSCNKLDSIAFPSSLKTIGNYAFGGCTSLGNIVFPEGIEEIGAGAFNECALTEIEFPESVKTIGARAFASCKGLIRVKLPGSGVTIGASAFSECGALNMVESAHNGTVGETIIGSEAFSRCNNLFSVDLPDNVSSIGQKVFYACSGLSRISWPGSVRTIEESAFASCTSLSQINLPEGLTTIGKSAFDACFSLTRINLPDSLTTIGESAFNSCRSLTEINLPDSLETIGKSAFKGCTLKRIELSENLSVIGSGAFPDCGLQTDIVLKSKNVTVEGGNLIKGNKIERLTISCGSVEVLTESFLSCWTSAGLIFSGPGYFRAEASFALGSPSRNRLKAGNYYADDHGALYLLKEDGTAALAYVPDGIAEYDVLADIPAEKEGDGWKITAVEVNALKMADNLEHLTFTAPKQIVSLPAYSCGNCPSLKSVNGKNTVDEIVEMLSDNAQVDPLAFYNTGLKEGGQAVLENGAIILKGGLVRIVSEMSGSTGNGGELYTGQRVTTSIEINNTSNEAGYDVVRCYFAFDNAEGEFPEHMPKLEEVRKNGSAELPVKLENGHTYTVRICESDIPYTYYFEIPWLQPGDTLKLPVATWYPSPSSAGASVKIWGRVLTKEEKENNGNSGAREDEDEYQQFSWITKPDEFPVKKSGYTPNVVAKKKEGAEGDEMEIHSLRFSISMSRKGDTLEDKGKDHMTSADFTDTLILPEGLKWRDGLLDAVKEGKLSVWNLPSASRQTLYVSSNGQRYELAVFSFSNSSMKLSNVDADVVDDGTGKETLRLRWTIENLKADTAEIPNAGISLTYGDRCVLMDRAPGEGEEYVVRNTVEAEQHFTYSGDQKKDAECEAKIPPLTPGEVNISKSHYLPDTTSKGTQYWGSPCIYTISLNNSKTLPYEGLSRIEDTLSEYLYIRPEDMKTMFESAESTESTARMEIIIKNAVLCENKGANSAYVPGKAVTGTDGKDYILSWQNTGAITSYEAETGGSDASIAIGNAELKLSWERDKGITLSYPKKDGNEGTVGGIDDIGAALESIGYLVTSQTKYAVKWYMPDDYKLYNGVRMDYKIPATVKDSFMQLQKDTRNKKSEESISIPINTATAYDKEDKFIKSGKDYAFSAYRDFTLYKGVSRPGTGMFTEGDFAHDGDVLNYSIAVTQKKGGLRDMVPLVDRMQGVQALIVPAEKNSQLGERYSLIPEEINEKSYYVLSSPGIYEKVWLGGDSAGWYLADSIAVEESEKGLDTMIRWYLPDTAGNKTLSYEAVVRTELGKEDGGSFSLSNESWLNDHETHRLYDVVGILGRDMEIDKKIVKSLGETPDKDTVDNYSLLKEGKETTYRLTIVNIGGEKTIKGADMYDVLPQTEGFQWKKENVAEIKYVSAQGASCTLKDENDWDVVNVTDPEGGDEQRIQWGENFELKLKGAVYIYVTLKWPSGEAWESIIQKNNRKQLENTFICYGQEAKVYHDLPQRAQAYLQKGVAGTETEEDSRIYYANLAYNGSSYSSDRYMITYYALVYNSGDTRLYLSKLQDRLPRGFTFNPKKENLIIPTSTAAKKNLSITDADGKTVTPKWVTADVEGVAKGNGIVEFTLSNKGSKQLKYDETKKMYYLDSEEAVCFEYKCNIGAYSATDELAQNYLVMPYTDVLGGEVDVARVRAERAAPEGVIKNDGGCYLLDTKQAREKGFLEGEEDTVWLASDVEVRRGGIIPGITKRVESKTSGNTTASNPAFAGIMDTINWSVTVTNSGRQRMVDYTLTDVMEAPYDFTGKVYYSLVNTSKSLFEIKESKAVETGEGKPELYTTLGWTEINTGTDNKWEKNGNLQKDKTTMQITGQDTVTMKVDGFQWEIRIFLNEKEERVLSLHFMGNQNTGLGNPSIVSGGSGVLKFSTVNHSGPYSSKTYFNKCYVTPESQVYDSSLVTQGNQTEYDGKPSVRNSARIQVTLAYATSSVKRVQEIGNEQNCTSSNNDVNYILLPDADKEFRYTLEVNNVADNQKAMKEIILIDSLPEKGDHNPFNEEEFRFSDFKVQLSETPDFYVCVRKKDAEGKMAEIPIEPSNYEIHYNEKTEFEKEDWEGGGAGWTTELKPDEARSFRIIIKDAAGTGENLIPPGADIIAMFNGRICDAAGTGEGKKGVSAGETAWNSFGYCYKMEGENTYLQATPLKVGIRIPDVPRLTKRLVDEDGEAYEAMAETSFRFLIYEGNPLRMKDGFTDEELAKALKSGNRIFTCAEITVKEGESQSESLILDGLKQWEYKDGADGTEAGWSETDVPWEWINSQKYTIVELPLEEESGCKFYSLAGSKNNAYTFTHLNAQAKRIQAVNIQERPAIFELPESGGTGVQGYMLAGVTCLLAAGFLLYRKRWGLRASR